MRGPVPVVAGKVTARGTQPRELDTDRSPIQYAPLWKSHSLHNQAAKLLESEAGRE